MKKNNTFLILSSFIVLIALGLFFYHSNEKTSKTTHTTNKLKDSVPKKAKKIVTNNSKTISQPQKDKQKSRGPATLVKKASAKSFQNNWKELANKRLAANLTEKFQIEIEPVTIKSIANGAFETKKVQEAIISITHPTGAKSSYSALIDPNTGVIIETFNHTQFENRDFYAVKLKADYNSLKLVPLNKKKQ